MQKEELTQQISIIKSKYDLAEIVGMTIPLKQLPNGEFIGRCPFHEEDTASFRVNTVRYHCFGCHAHGDIISWTIRFKNLGFPDAIRLLNADQTNNLTDITIPKKKLENFSRIDTATAHEIIKLNEYLQPLFVEQLLTEKKRDTDVWRYVSSRFTPWAIERFSIGYTKVSQDEFWKRCKGFNEELLEAAGITAVGHNGASYPRYRDRIMIPLRNKSSHILGFLGRIIPREVTKGLPKYINPPETPAFKRSRYIFNVDRISEVAPQSLVLTEGAVDAIALQAAGLKNVVSSLGCHLTHEQVKVLENITRKVVIIYDGDLAGLNAYAELAPRLLESELNWNFVLLSNDEDPDTLTKQYSASEVVRRLREYPRLECSEFFRHELRVAEAKEFDTSLLQEIARPYVEDNIKNGWPHYNILDWCMQAYPKYAQAIKDAVKKMVTDTEEINGKKSLKRENVIALIQEWKKPCRDVRRAHGKFETEGGSR